MFFLAYNCKFFFTHLMHPRLPPQKTKELVLQVVNQIPQGKVITYGRVADHIGVIARTVGWIMATLSDEEMEKVPWHRVIGANGTVPALKYGFRGEVQIQRLEEEGLHFGKSRLEVDKDQWFNPTLG
jgi:methylated-DNA-protein-cysteine methyltransferase related protein